MLATLVSDFAAGMVFVDSRRPVAVNARSKAAYHPGLGPHTERQTVKMVAEALRSEYEVTLEAPYPDAPRSKCDLFFEAPEFWAIEVKMLRLMGDNGKPNDNILMHILSPYPAHRSAVTDAQKLLTSGFDGKKGILIYGYDYPDWPMEPAIEAFELLTSRIAKLGQRCVSEAEGLIHPVHRRAKVFGWQIESAA